MMSNAMSCMRNFISVALAQLSCPNEPNCSAPLCPNTAVQYTCNISVPRTFTRWTVPAQSCDGTDTTLLLLRQSAQSNCGNQSIQCGLFEASNVPPVGDTPCTSSILHVNVIPELNGSLITCNSSDVSVQYSVGSAKIVVLSAPSAPHLSVTAKLNALEANCSCGDENAYCNVTIEINGAVQTTAANATFNGLTSNSMYHISARAINRCEDYSETSAAHWTLPEAPPFSTIRVLQSSINGSATQLDIYWTHVGGNVSQYMVVSISETNIYTSQVSVQNYCVALSCTCNQIVKTTGSHYTITISSVNDGGVGPYSDPVQVQSETSSSPSCSVAVGVGVSLAVICIAAALVFITCFWRKKNQRSKDSINNNSLPEFNNNYADVASRNDEKSPLYDHLSASGDKVNQSSSPKKECETSQEHQSDSVQNNRKPLKRMPHYIKAPHGRIVLTIQDDKLVFEMLNYIPDDKQLWYTDDQPDNSFMIVSKMNNNMVLANTESEITIQIRCGNKGQKWLHDSNTIVSAVDEKIMCIKDQKNEPVCVKKSSRSGFQPCYLASCFMVPMCLVNEEDGSVLQISGDKVIAKPSVDFTNVSQHWYIYPNSEGSNAFTIVARNEQKVLQLDDNAELVLKSCDSEEGEAAGWTVLNGCLHCASKQKWLRKDKRMKVYPMFRNCFIISFQSYYLMKSLLTEEIALSDIANKLMPFGRHLWMLDMQPDGTFTIASCANNAKFVSCKDNKLVCCDFISDGIHLWRQEQKFIKSESTHGYLDIYFPPKEEFVEIKSIEGVSRPEDECVTLHSHPFLAISTGDKQQFSHEFKVTKMVIQVSQIAHQETGLVLSRKNGNADVSMCPANSLPCTHFWTLDYQLDGTFFIISNTKEMSMLSCDSSTSTPTERKLTMSRLQGDDSQLWSWDGGHIISVKFRDQVISLMPDKQTLCLSTKCATDKSQQFKQESYAPVLITCLMDDTVLELDDASALKFSAVDKSQPDSQVWYLKYSNEFSNPSFMIISKKNNKALQNVGENVETQERDPTNEDQQWRRDGLLIISHSLKSKKVMASKDQMLVLEIRYSDMSSSSYSGSHFEFQHIAIASYF